jgi:hypothetical protein
MIHTLEDFVSKMRVETDVIMKLISPAKTSQRSEDHLNVSLVRGTRGRQGVVKVVRGSFVERI